RHDGKRAEPAAKAAAPIDPQIAVSQIESGKDGQTHDKPDKAASEFHHAAADLITKLSADAPAPANGDTTAAAKAGTDAVQNAGAVTPAGGTNAQAAAPPGPANPLGQAQPAAVPLSGLAVEIATQAQAGRHHFEIRLDPPELGRI